MYYAKIPIWLIAIILFIVWFALKRLGQINTKDTKRLLNQNAVIIDVRTPSEYKGGNIQGSTNIPLSNLANSIDKTVKSKETPILCYCLSGTRSGAAVSQLKKRGYNAYNVGSYHRARKLLT